MAQWKKLLTSLGFSESETTVYLASLEAGPVSVQDLAKKAGVSRVTTYAVIESLTKQGLMSSVEKGKKKLVVAEAPERLMSHVASRLKSMEATLKEAESNLQDLKLIQRGEKPVVKMFEGKDALKAIMTDIIATRPEQIDEWGNLDEILNVYSREELEGWYKEFERNLPKQHVTRSFLLTKHNAIKSGRVTKHLVESLSPSIFAFGGDLLVYANKVALSTFRGKQISVLIESEDLATTLRQMFDMLLKKR